MLFVDSLTDAARRWAVPIEQGEWWDHPAMPFHVVLVGQREVLKRASQRWRAVGAELQTVEGIGASTCGKTGNT